MSKIGLYSPSLAGHRKSYLELIQNAFDGQRLGYWGAVFSSRPVFFLMIEDSPIFYFCVGLFRSLFRRKTVGLLFRPKDLVEPRRYSHKIKRAMFALLKRVTSVKTLLIIPFYTDSRFKCLFDGWVYDFQLWDLEPHDRVEFERVRSSNDCSELVEEVAGSRAGRLVMSSVGGQDRIKGFDRFSSAYIDNALIRENYLFVFGGKVKEFEASVAPFSAAGGVARNRFLADEELISFYAFSDLVWCLYAPDYDQASGILGRAAQLGVPVLVRQSSLVHKICEKESIAHVALEPDDVPKLVSIVLPAISPDNGLALAHRLKGESLGRLARVLN